jgi:hypothetical protein
VGSHESRDSEIRAVSAATTKGIRQVQKITPFLWFDHQAEEAAKCYTTVFKNSKAGRILRYGEEVAK